MLVTLADAFGISSDGAEASVEAEVTEDIELREGAELLSELFDAEADARGVETFLLALTSVTGAAIGGGRTGSATAHNCDIICGKGM